MPIVRPGKASAGVRDALDELERDPIWVAQVYDAPALPRPLGNDDWIGNAIRTPRLRCAESIVNAIDRKRHVRRASCSGRELQGWRCRLDVLDQLELRVAALDESDSKMG